MLRKWVVLVGNKLHDHHRTTPSWYNTPTSMISRTHVASTVTRKRVGRSTQSHGSDAATARRRIRRIVWATAPATQSNMRLNHSTSTHASSGPPFTKNGRGTRTMTTRSSTTCLEFLAHRGR